MIVLDTNVVSEFVRPAPNTRVMSWFDAARTTPLYTTSITVGELYKGVAILDDGRRKTVLKATVEALVDEDFAQRVLPFDEEAAKAYADIWATRRRAGRPITEADCQIAAITRIWDARLATRNTKDFEDCGIKLLNPWSDPI